MKAKNTIIMIIACCLLTAGATHIASEHPDGLERIAKKMNFLGKSEDQGVISSPMPNYEIPLIKNKLLSSGLAGIIGVLSAFIGTYLLGTIIKKFSNKRQ